MCMPRTEASMGNNDPEDNQGGREHQHSCFEALLSLSTPWEEKILVEERLPRERKRERGREDEETAAMISSGLSASADQG